MVGWARVQTAKCCQRIFRTSDQNVECGCWFCALHEGLIESYPTISKHLRNDLPRGRVCACGHNWLRQFGAADGDGVRHGHARPETSGGCTHYVQSEHRAGSRGLTNANGTYELKYVGDQKGALVGEHAVTITTKWMDEDPATGKMTQHAERLPAKFNTSSEIRKTVVAGHNTFDFETTSK